MTHPITLAIGHYNEMDSVPNTTELNAAPVGSVKELSKLGAEQRAAVRAAVVHAHEAFDGAVMDLLPNLELIVWRWLRCD